MEQQLVVRRSPENIWNSLRDIQIMSIYYSTMMQQDKKPLLEH
jgi:hypothetical protein